MHVETHVTLLSHERFSGVNPNANAKRAVPQALTDLLGSVDGMRGSREGGEERVTLRVHLDSRMPAKSTADYVAVGGEKVRVQVAMLLEQLGRARDIGEKERDGAAWKILSHAESIMPPRQVSRLPRRHTTPEHLPTVNDHQLRPLAEPPATQAGRTDICATTAMKLTVK
jgi:hypothetical protein